MKIIKISTLWLFCLIISADISRAQRNTVELTFNEFLQHVLANNLELIIETYEVSIAEAAVVAARVFEDPELEMLFPHFEGDEFSGFPRNIEFELEVPVELFGKRRNRIRQARAERFAAEAELDDFLRFLRTEAAATYIEVLTFQRILERMDLTLNQLNRLAEINQALLEAGEVGEIEVIQTRLEARIYLSEIYDVSSELTELMSEVWFLMGSMTDDSLVFVSEPLPGPQLLSYDDLRQQALDFRPDILAAERRVEAGEFNLRLARAERLPDISIIAGYHNEHAIRPMPGFPAFYAGLIIPLRFSGINRGAMRQSMYALEQTRTELQAVRLDAEAGLRSAWDRYLLFTQKRNLFTERILSDAERVRDAIVFSYQRGDVSLLQVLEAQRTMNEVHMNYYETLSQHARSLVDLSAESGLWLIEFDSNKPGSLPIP
jgi:outer membrane protein, heavy metal efflux system